MEISPKNIGKFRNAHQAIPRGAVKYPKGLFHGDSSSPDLVGKRQGQQSLVQQTEPFLKQRVAAFVVAQTGVQTGQFGAQIGRAHV